METGEWTSQQHGWSHSGKPCDSKERRIVDLLSSKANPEREKAGQHFIESLKQVAMPSCLCI